MRSSWILALLCLAAPQEPTAAAPIDAHFEAAWKAAGLVPTAVADDCTWLRRVSLDLLGRLPRPEEIRGFVADKDPAKRAKLVERHLASEECADFLADVWLDVLVDHAVSNQDFARADLGPFKLWLRSCFAEDVPYDRMVRALLSDRGPRRDKPAVNYSLKHLAADPLPVKLAVLSARHFLGRDLRCAQCHDDPFQSLTQEEFWGWVGFFRPLRNAGDLVELKEAPRAAKRDDFGELAGVPARFLDGRSPDPAKRLGESLADLALSMEDNSVAKAFVDRAWKHFFGRRLAAEPPRSPGVPALLDRLAADFRRDGCRIRPLLRAIVSSRPYQLSSAGKDEDRKRYAAGPLKAMGAIQYFRVFTDLFTLHELHMKMYEQMEKSAIAGVQFKDPEVMRIMFYAWSQDLLLPRGRDPEAVEGIGTVRMAMKTMNNKRVQDMISGYWGRLKQVCEKRAKPAERIEELCLVMWGRFPTDDERREYAKFVGNPAYFDRKPIEDLFWVMLNSSEFLFNH